MIFWSKIRFSCKKYMFLAECIFLQKYDLFAKKCDFPAKTSYFTKRNATFLQKYNLLVNNRILLQKHNLLTRKVYFLEIQFSYKNTQVQFSCKDTIFCKEMQSLANKHITENVEEEGELRCENFKPKCMLAKAQSHHEYLSI